eukprot:TRINITY_DN38352_c0_g1_i1.p1 TRINITY_DN38352_c0_g1~~TRINITY_DN38352_c0_g1_i1.p1  ORF type:complete len:165 (+),score=31.09 TRINITY_DN38352_c0_g1_i1:51-545(+)
MDDNDSILSVEGVKLTAKGKVDALNALTEASGDDDYLLSMNYLAFWGKGQATQLFLAMGQDPHAADANGDTALHWAARGGYTAPIKNLLRAGASAQTVNHHGQTPPQIAEQLNNTHAAAALTATSIHSPSSARSGTLLRSHMPSHLFRSYASSHMPLSMPPTLP